MKIIHHIVKLEYFSREHPSRIFLGQGIWLLRQDIIGQSRPFEGILSANGLF